MHRSRATPRRPPGSRPPRAASARPPGGGAFALIDLLLAVALIGILALVVAPALRPDESMRLISASVVLAADIEYAQSLTLASPADPVRIRVESGPPRYWLARASDPETPIERPTGGPFEVVFGEGLAAHLAGIGLRLEEGQDGALVFDPLGRLPQTVDARIVLVGLSSELPVRVASNTGSVFIGQ